MSGFNTWTTATVNLPLVREAAEDNQKVRTPQDVRDCMRDIAKLAQEAFMVLTLNAKNGLIDKKMITLGLVDASLVHPREVFRGAIADNASAIILCHNHPSGDCNPSTQDIKITNQLIEAGKVVDIKVLDHVIVSQMPGDAGFLSMRETGIVNF